MVIIPAVSVHEATLVFLHGLGDTANGWAPVMRMLSHTLPTVKFILPTAASRPVTINYGGVMPAWYDILSLDGADQRRVDVEGIKQSVDLVQSLVDNEPPGVKVLVGGFSQGGCVALALATGQSPHSGRLIDGCISLSGYFADTNRIGDYKQLPIFMGHGHADPVVSYKWALQSCKRIKELGFTNLTFHDYHGLQHGASDRELDDMVAFIKSVISKERHEL